AQRQAAGRAKAPGGAAEGRAGEAASRTGEAAIRTGQAEEGTGQACARAGGDRQEAAEGGRRRRSEAESGAGVLRRRKGETTVGRSSLRPSVRRANMRLKHLARDERGMSFVFVGVGFFAFLSATTLAIDVGMFMTARSQAQNAADAGALAGATALVFNSYTDHSAGGPVVQSEVNDA